MISSLPSNTIDTSSDPFSFMGKVTLAVGSGYGVYKTMGQIPTANVKSAIGGAGAFTKARSNLLSVKPTQTAIRPSNLTFTTLGDIVQGPTPFQSVGVERARGLLGEAVRGSPTGGRYLEEFENLLTSIEGRGYQVGGLSFEPRYSGKNLVDISFKAGERRFTTAPVYGGTDIYRGQGQPVKYTARRVVSSLPGQEPEIIDISTAVLKRQREQIGKILPEAGVQTATELLPRDIELRGVQTAIFEDIAQGRPFYEKGFTGAKPVTALRQYEAIVDPFGDLPLKTRTSIIQRFTEEGVLMPGSASMTTKGIAMLAGSPLEAMQGAAFSPVGRQFIREAEFVKGGRTPTVKQPFENMRAFNFGVVNPKEVKRFQQAIETEYQAAVTTKDVGAQKRLGAFRFGELAEEEYLFNKGLRGDVSIRNQIYQYEIDLSRLDTQVTGEFGTWLDDLAQSRNVSRQGLLTQMAEPGGISFDELRLLSLKGNSLPLGYAPAIAGQEKRVVSTLNDLDSYVSRLLVDNNKSTLKVSVASEYAMDQFQKIFGTFKGTAKAVVDVPGALAHMEMLRTGGRLATAEELARTRGQFTDIDLLIADHPYKSFLETFKTGGPMQLPLKQVQPLIESTLTQATTMGGFGEEYIKAMGYTRAGGQLELASGIAPENLVTRFQKFAELNRASPEFARLVEPTTGAGGFITKLSGTVAPEFHRFQMGAGQRAATSQRSFLNIATMFPELGEEVAGRMVYPLGHLPQYQMGEFLKYRSLMQEGAAESISLAEAKPALENLFSPNLQTRKRAIQQLTGSAEAMHLSINLGRTVTPGKGSVGVRNIVATADPELATFIGERIGQEGRATLYDEAMRDIGVGALGEGPEAASAVTRFQNIENKILTSIEKNIFRGGVKGSLFAQAQSELPGMAAFAEEFGQGANVIAVHQADLLTSAKEMGIAENQMLEMARGGKLWSITSREPAEGLHRAQPTLVGIAEDLGAMKGRGGVMYFSGWNQEVENQVSSMRKALGVDFDADQTSTIFFTREKSVATLREAAIGGATEAGILGKEFAKTQVLFSSIPLKEKAAENAFEMTKGSMTQRLLEIGETEKGLIPLLSTELKDVHAGFRMMIAEDMTAPSLARAFRGEALSLLLAEYGIKAKHRTTEALAGSMDVVEILKNREGERLQNYFDKLVLSKRPELGAEIRAAGKFEAPMLAEIAKAKALNVDDALRFAEAYRDVSGTQNVEEVFRAADYGAYLRKAGINEQILRGETTAIGSLTKRIDTTVTGMAPAFRKGLKNIGIYGILPAAGIGLAATILDSGSKRLPIELSSAEHEKTTQPPSRVSAENKVFAMPKKQRLNISGRVSKVPNPEIFSRYFDGSNINLNISDRRSHMTQDYIDRKIKRGL